MDSALELECSAVGVPPPTLSWLKDGRPLEGADIVQEDGHFVRISKVRVNCNLTISENIKKMQKITGIQTDGGLKSEWCQSVAA